MGDERLSVADWPRVTWSPEDNVYFPEFRDCSDEVAVLSDAIGERVRCFVGSRSSPNRARLRMLDFGGGPGQISRALRDCLESSATVEPDASGRYALRIDGAAPQRGELSTLLTGLPSFDVFLFCHVLPYVEHPWVLFDRLAEYAAPDSLWIAVLPAPEGDQYEVIRRAGLRGLTSRPPEHATVFGRLLDARNVRYEVRTLTSHAVARDCGHAKQIAAFFAGCNESTFPDDVMNGMSPERLSTVHDVFSWERSDTLVSQALV